MVSHLKIAQLSAESVSKINALEKETGFQIMAFEPAVTIADLTDHQLAKIKELEGELQVTLLAYEA